MIILKRRKLQEIELNWESFTDYILHTAFSRKLAEPTNRGRLPDLGSSELGTKPTLRNSRLVKRSIQDGTLYDGSNDEVLQCAFVPNPFPYNLIDGHHWTLWYNSSTQPHCDDMITEDIQKKIIAELGPTAPFDFAWQVQANDFCFLSCLSFPFPCFNIFLLIFISASLLTFYANSSPSDILFSSYILTRAAGIWIRNWLSQKYFTSKFSGLKNPLPKTIPYSLRQIIILILIYITVFVVAYVIIIVSVYIHLHVRFLFRICIIFTEVDLFFKKPYTAVS